MRCMLTVFALLLSTGLARAESVVIEVDDDASLRAALNELKPGVTVRIAPGKYSPSIHLQNVRGTRAAPIILEGADADDRPVFVGGTTGIQVSNAEYLVLRKLAFQGQSGNGLNIDDGGSYDTPTHHILLEDLHLSEIGPRGNFDGIKLSGVDDFRVLRCHVEGWGGQAVDMVGCHRGLIDQCSFVGREGFSQTTGPQMKGGTSEVVVRRCFFDHAAMRGVNIGGSTGREFFRPLDALYEAKNITVERCVFLGCQAPIAFVGVDGAVVKYNTIIRPEKWVMRILQETRDEGFATCRDGVFGENLIVFRRSEVGGAVNIGPNTAPETFRFGCNYWYCEDRPDASRPRLPTPEREGTYGRDPKLDLSDRERPIPRDPSAASFGALAKQADAAPSRK